jgi:nitrate reductase NapAB chaperone NapD
MSLIGILARVDAAHRTQACEELARLPGVSLFSVHEEERIGILVERESLAESHAALKDEVETIPGILGAWPVFSYSGDEGELDDSAVDRPQSGKADVDG